MVNRFAVIVVLFLAVVVGSMAANTDLKQYNKRSDNSSGMTVEDATKTCNQSFAIKADYLAELNRTGSFPDESDVMPMCFIKCYLEKMDIISDEGDINEEKAIQLLPDTTKEMVVDCSEEMEKGTDICEKAYYILRCIMTRILVDGRSKD